MDGKQIIRRHASLWGAQANFRTYWDQLSYFVMPAQATFLGQVSEGLKRTERLFDSSAVMANERFAAAIESMLTPRSQIWHDLAPEDDDIADDPECKAYLDRVKQQLFAMRYRVGANFSSQTHENYLSLGGFGNMVLFVDDAVNHADIFRDSGPGTLYRAIPMQETVWECDHTGRVCALYRCFKLTAEQSVSQFGDKCPEKISKMAGTDNTETYEFIHYVGPNKAQTRARGPAGMPFESVYVLKADALEIDRSGYKCWPFGIGRYSMAPSENYGRGPAMASFPAIRTLNEEKKTVLRAGQKSVDPPILLYEEGVLEAFNQRPGAANYGMLTADGTPLAAPFENKANIPLGLELMQLEKGDINDAFLVSLFQFLSQRTDTMTAAEVYARQAQVATMLAPAMGRQQSEYLGAIIHRELQVGFDSGVFDSCGPMPDKLRRRGGAYKVEYTSPLSRAARAPQATAIIQTLQSAGEMAQLDPSVMLRFDLDAASQEIADINGMPAKLIRTDEQVAALKQQQEAEKQAAAVTQAAPALSQSELNLAQAAQARAGASAAPGVPAAA